MKVLIVDDNVVNRKLLGSILLANGHEISESGNGLEALDVLDDSPFDALISDVLMPDMDGYRLCYEVRRNERSKDLPIVIYSSLYTRRGDEQIALRAGADRFLKRPSSSEILLATLQDVCEIPRSVADPGENLEPEHLRSYSEKLVTQLKGMCRELESARARLVEANETLCRTKEALEREVCESKRRGEEVEHLAFHDALTGLPNRLLFNDRLTVALSQARRHQRKLATFFMDLDNFKEVNDTLGHAIGDELLRMVADRLRTFVREEDTLARFGGDEFILLVTGINTERDVATVSEKILATIRPPFELCGREVPITLSVGASVFPVDGEAAKVLVKNADAAMYRSKKEGRNTYQLFTPVLSTVAPESL